MWLSPFNILHGGVVIFLISAILYTNCYHCLEKTQLAPSSVSSVNDFLQSGDASVSQFLNLIKDSPLLSNTSSDFTIFAPNLDAIRAYGKNLNEATHFHFTKGTKLTSQLQDVPTSSTQQIWVTTQSNSSRIFVNDAEIDSEQRNYQITTPYGTNHTIHVIDRVLVPNWYGFETDNSTSEAINCPNAGEFLSIYCSHFQCKTIKLIIDTLLKNTLFEASGGHTFFVPLETYFNRFRMEWVLKSLDPEIIEAQVIPNRVLYLRPTLAFQIPGTQYITASDPYSPILIQLKNGSGAYENSVIVQTDSKSSIIEAEVLVGSIPVSNGVVHLISRPLTLLKDETIRDILARGREYNEFLVLLQDFAPPFILQRLGDGQNQATIFVPSQEAMRRNLYFIHKLKSHPHWLTNCLLQHIILDVVWSANMSQEVSEVTFDTWDPNTQISFTHDKESDKFTVNNCGGVANITQPNIGARNGVIHRIDDLLCGKFTCPTPIDAISQFDDLSEFSDLLKSEKFLKTLQKANWTLFVPTNSALQKYGVRVSKLPDYGLRHHFIHSGLKTEDLEYNLNSGLSTRAANQPPLWISKGGSDIFVNNAKIHSHQRNLLFNNISNQIFHVIDRVLELIIFQLPHWDYTPSPSDLNPDAYHYMANFKPYNVESAGNGQMGNNVQFLQTNNHTIKQWTERVSILKNSDIFKWSGGHTFFIPVDKAFDFIPIVDITNEMIESHIILNKVLFLRPSSLDPLTRHSTAYSSNRLRIRDMDQDNGDGIEEHNYVVESHFLNQDNFNYLQGVVQADIVFGNIPLANGVLHVISKPLTIISNPYKTLAIEKSSSEFFQLISEHASPQLKELLYRPPTGAGVTVLVPSNAAIVSKKEIINSMETNGTLLDEFLRCHLLSGIWPPQFLGTTQQAETLTRKTQKFINFTVVDQLDKGRRNYMLGVDGGNGNNATIQITTKNLRTTNGVIHIIDGVLDCGSNAT